VVVATSSKLRLRAGILDFLYSRAGVGSEGRGIIRRRAISPIVPFPEKLRHIIYDINRDFCIE
jgi:hypothetical protein